MRRRRLSLANQQYALALLIGSMCDRETYRLAVRRFVKCLPARSPLQTKIMLFSGFLEDDVSSINETNSSSFWRSDDEVENDNSWRYHLASIIANRAVGWDRLVVSLGDELLRQKNILAGHFCYLVGGCHVTADPSSTLRHLVLLGCDDALNHPLHSLLFTEESVEGFLRTEAFEWARRRGNPNVVFPVLQRFKLRYAAVLADAGEVGCAWRYLESLRECVGEDVEEDGGGSSVYGVGFGEELNVMEDRLCVFLGREMKQRKKKKDDEGGGYFGRAFKSFTKGVIKLPGKKEQEENKQNSTHQVVPPMTETNEEPLSSHMAPPVVAQSSSTAVPPINQALAPQQPTNVDPNKTTQQASFVPLNKSVEKEKDAAPKSLPVQPSTPSQKETTAPKTPSAAAKSSASKPTPKSTGGKPKSDKKESAPNSGLGGAITSWLINRINPNAKIADTGLQMEAHYDEKLKRWIFPGDDPVEMAKPLPPPPTAIPKVEDATDGGGGEAKKEDDNATNDPLAALMAPPPTRAGGGGMGGALGRRYPGMGGGGAAGPPPLGAGPPPMMMMPPMMAGSPKASAGGVSPAAAAAIPPKFTVFQPKPKVKEETTMAEAKKEEGADNSSSSAANKSTE